MTPESAQESALVRRRQDVSHPNANQCPRCGKSFHCGASAGDARCWCFEMPTLEVRSGNASCFCPACLTELSELTGKAKEA